jgi:hypothetical protein
LLVRNESCLVYTWQLFLIFLLTFLVDCVIIINVTFYLKGEFSPVPTLKTGHFLFPPIHGLDLAIIPDGISLVVVLEVGLNRLYGAVRACVCNYNVIGLDTINCGVVVVRTHYVGAPFLGREGVVATYGYVYLYIYPPTPHFSIFLFLNFSIDNSKNCSII